MEESVSEVEAQGREAQDETVASKGTVDCVNYWWVSFVYFLVQMDSSQLIHCRELAAHHLSALQSSLPLNSVYVYRPLKHTLVSCDRGAFKLHPSSVSGPGFSKDNSKPEVPVRSTTAFYHHLPAASGCKHTSAKRKVEEMEVDDFYDGIKRLYNEDNASENVGSVCSTDLSRQEGHASPCPPLQPVSVM